MYTDQDWHDRPFSYDGIVMVICPHCLHEHNRAALEEVATDETRSNGGTAFVCAACDRIFTEE